MVVALIYIALGYWATGRTIYADKILIGDGNAIFGNVSSIEKISQQGIKFLLVYQNRNK